MIMKTNLTKTDKVSIIRGLKEGVFNITALNHLTKDIRDYEADEEIFGEIALPITTNDKRVLLASLKSGNIDFDQMPDLLEKIKENFFLRVMMECNP